MHTVKKPVLVPVISSKNPFAAYRLLFEAELKRFLKSASLPLLRVPLQAALEGGKRIRPLIALLSAEAVSGDARAGLAPALAAELLHAASLLHDDMMDRASMRHGKPSAHSAYGLNQALLAGDYLVALAYEALHGLDAGFKTECCGLLNAAHRQICEGQALEEDTAARKGECTLLAIIRKKTASLIEFSAAAGARAAGAGDAACKTLGCFGVELGTAFQIQDDFLDISATAEQTGKDAGLDLRNGKVTLAGLLGAAVSRRRVAVYTQKALTALTSLDRPGAGNRLAQLAASLTDRKR